MVVTDSSKAEKSTSERRRKFWHFVGQHGWWMIIVISLCGYGIFIWLMATRPFPGLPVTAPMKPTVIETQEVQLAGGGTLFITDIRTGTEFNRILKLPDGKFVVEGGYIENAHEPCF